MVISKSVSGERGVNQSKQAKTFSPGPRLPSVHFTAASPVPRTLVLSRLVLAPFSPPSLALTIGPQTPNPAPTHWVPANAHSHIQIYEHFMLMFTGASARLFLSKFLDLCPCSAPSTTVLSLSQGPWCFKASGHVNSHVKAFLLLATGYLTSQISWWVHQNSVLSGDGEEECLWAGSSLARIAYVCLLLPRFWEEAWSDGTSAMQLRLDRNHGSWWAPQTSSASVSISKELAFGWLEQELRKAELFSLHQPSPQPLPTKRCTPARGELWYCSTLIFEASAPSAAAD